MTYSLKREKERMTKPVIPFSKPFFSEEDIKEINARIEEILRSGWLTSGPVVERFEGAFADFVGTKHAVALNSCTAALHTTLLVLGVGSGDEVVVPSNTFVATANAAIYVRAKPVFADSDPLTFNIAPHEIQERISRKTKAIIVVHVGGNPCDMKEIQEIATDHNIPLIEDCAHAHGARYKGVNCGTFGIAGCFSFYPTKIVTAAEGGIVTTDDEALANRIRILRNHGRATSGPSEVVELGFNYRLSEVHAAIGITQLKHVTHFLEARNKLAEVYNERLASTKWLEPQRIRNGNLCSHYVYIVKLTDEAPLGRDALMKRLRDQGIETSVLYHPVHLQPFYVKLFGYRKGELPVAEELGEKSLALPLYNGMKVDDVAGVVEAIRDVLTKSSCEISG